MSTDYNIALSCGKVFNSFFLFFLRAETGEQFNIYPERFKPFGNCLIVLEGKNCCRHNNRNLFSRSYRLKYSAHCNFCFTEADITTNKPVHRLFAFHICFNVIYCFHLVRSFGVFKSFFHFNLPCRIR